MRPTFRDGDLLIVQTMGLDSVNCGDVVVFRSEGAGESLIIHRTRSKHPHHLVTKGDANRFIDMDLVSADKLVGRAEWVEREGMHARVRNGRLGQWQGFVAGLRALLVVLIRLVGHWVGGLLVRQAWLRGLVRRVWRPKLRAACFCESGSAVLKVFTNRRRVAVWRFGPEAPSADKPYDILVGSHCEDMNLIDRATRLRELLESCLRNKRESPKEEGNRE